MKAAPKKWAEKAKAKAAPKAEKKTTGMKKEAGKKQEVATVAAPALLHLSLSQLFLPHPQPHLLFKVQASA